MTNKFVSMIIVLSVFIHANSQRVKTVVYNPNSILVITASVSKLTLVQFDEGEDVLDGSTGFNEGWIIKKSGNIAYITPKPYLSSLSEEEGTGEIVQRKTVIEPYEEEWNTNFFIRTNKRLYMGDLKLSSKNSNYKISFKYPKERLSEKKERWQKMKKEKKKKNIELALNRTTIPRNWNFFKKVNRRSGDIAPNYVYDDGKFTYFGFDRTKKMPAIFLKDGEEESSTNSHTKRIGKYYVKVVHKTGKVFFLRSGKKLVGILNNSYRVNPNFDYDTTSNKIIKRVIKR